MPEVTYSPGANQGAVSNKVGSTSYTLLQQPPVAYIYTGHTTSGDRLYSYFALYSGVAIPRGATINSAYIKIQANTATNSISCEPTIRFEDSGNATKPTTSAQWNNKVRTTASVNWQLPAFVANDYYTSPNIAAVIQSIVNRSDWVEGNAMLMMLEPLTYTENGHRNPKNIWDLTINYTPQTATINSVTFDKTSPQIAGTTIKITCSASGGVAPLEYKFADSSALYEQTIRDYALTNYCNWTPDAKGACTIKAYVKSAGKLQEDATALEYFTILGPPIITILDYDRTKISNQPGVDSCEVEFIANDDLIEWEARAGGSGVGQGLLVGSGKALDRYDTGYFDVDHDELTQGDKAYRINVYGKNADGLWSDYE